MSSQKNLDFESDFDGVTAAPSGREYVEQHGVVDDLDIIIAQSVQNAGGSRDVTAATDTITEADNGKIIVYNRATAIAVGIAVATALSSKFKVHIINLGVGDVTITPTTSTINGVASEVFNTDQGCTIFRDGANYVAQMGAATGGGSGDTWTMEEQVTGTADGVNATFTVVHTPVAGTFSLFTSRGLRLLAGVGYTRAGDTITMAAGYIPANSGEKPYADYAY